MVMKALVENTVTESFPEMTDDGSLKVKVTNETPISVTLESEHITLTGPVTVGNEVEVKNDTGNPIPVVGPLTNAELRANPIQVDTGGTDATGVAFPAGATGARGWLSGIFSLLSGVLKVSGNAAAGAPPSGNPVSVAGVDSAGNKQHLKTDTGGNVGIYGAAQRVSSAVAIASGATVSDVMDFSTTALLGFILPAAWTAGTLAIEVSANNLDWATAGITDASGSAASNWSSSAASAAYSVDVLSMLPYRYARFRSGTAQTSTRSITVITRSLA